MRTYVRMERAVICLYIPRFELLCALAARPGGGDRPDGRGAGAGDEGGSALPGRACALAPLGSGGIGEVSAAAQALGVRAGMRVGEALARAPQLELLRADPLLAERCFERVLGALEAVGAAPEVERAGTAYLRAEPLYRLHGGLDGVVRALQGSLARLARARGALAASVACHRLGVGRSRFHALLAARRARARRALTFAPGRAERHIAALPLGALALRAELVELIEPLAELGVASLGELLALGPQALGERFGRAGLLAYDLVRGHEQPVCGRPAAERIEEQLTLAGPLTGQALEHALSLLLDRLLAHPGRRARSIRTLSVAAALAGGGSWRRQIALRSASAHREQILLAVSRPLLELPAPAERLTLAVERFGAPVAEQLSLTDGLRAQRSARLREAISQVRAALGVNSLLRIAPLEEGSRAPERRFILTPRE